MSATINPLPRDELNRRLKLVVGHVIEEAQRGAAVPFVVGRNVDRTYMPVEMAAPAVEDTMLSCAICGDSAWFGPKIIKMQGTRVCFICAALISNVVKSTTTIGVDPEASERTRRVT